MADFRAMDFGAIDASYPAATVNRKVRGLNKQFVVERSSQQMAVDALGNPTTRQVTVVVKWAFKNVTSQNRVVSVVARP